jgi:hypothetical protein
VFALCLRACSIRARFNTPPSRFPEQLRQAVLWAAKREVRDIAVRLFCNQLLRESGAQPGTSAVW